MHDERAEVREAVPKPPRGGRGGPLSSRSLRLAILITIIGLGLWVYALATRSPEPPSPVPASTLASGLAPSAGPAPAAQTAPRLIDDSAPALLRFGLSFVVGFFLAWILRRVITVTLLAAGAIATLILILKKTGAINLDWSSVENQVNEGVEFAKRESGRVKDLVLGYLPSSLSALGGLFLGARHRS